MSDYSVQRSYIELILDLPWNQYSKDKFDLAFARKILDSEHFGLTEVKERIIEHLAVLKLKRRYEISHFMSFWSSGSRKTSLGKSIAALGRNYERVSLGGLRDEAEIRGHRKPILVRCLGRIIKSIKKANSSNPVFF